MSDVAPPQSSRYERKREAILEAAAALFNARGLGRATLGEVAQAVGLTTASVTYYYRKKEDLAAACLRRAIEALAAQLDQAQAERLAPPERLERMLRLHFDHLAAIAEGRMPVEMNFWDLRALSGPQAAPTLGAFVGLFRRFRTLFEEPDGPRFSRAEQNARAHLVFSQITRCKSWANRYEPEDYGRAAARMADVLIGGMAGPGRQWSPRPLAIDPLGPPDPTEVSREAFLRAATEMVNDHGYRGASGGPHLGPAERHQGLVSTTTTRPRTIWSAPASATPSRSSAARTAPPSRRLQTAGRG